MHDIDRNVMEGEYEMETYDDEFENEEEYEDEYAYGESEYDDEFEYEEEDEGEYEFDGYETVFSEEEEMDLASELLAVTDEAELDQFLGKLIKRGYRKAKKFAKSSTGRALRKVLRKVAKKALPIAGRAAGTFFGGPAGGAIGGKLASSAGKIFGLELEGLSPEDQEFEVAKRVVRLAGSAAKKAAKLPAQTSPNMAAKIAVTTAAKKHAPGLLRPIIKYPVTSSRNKKGRWVRKGNKIILIGV
ncbi:MAG: hypothetical protein V3U87_05270 [Methylococcaceae bacterium]